MLHKEIVDMKRLFCMMLAALLISLPVMAAMADEAVIADQESAEVVDQDDDAWDEPVDIEYKVDGTEEADEEADEEAEEEAETSPFFGEWLCGDAAIYIDEAEGAFNVHILWDTGDTGEDVWEYTCALDAGTGALTGDGSKRHEVLGEMGEVVSSEEIYTDGSAVFTLEDGALIWDDAKEDIAHGMRFEHSEEEELLEEYDIVDESGEEADEEAMSAG